MNPDDSVLPDGDILTVTLNPALDLTAGLDELVPGAVNRVAMAQSDPGGKGVNVAGFLAPWQVHLGPLHLGQVRLAATGFLGGDNAEPFRNMFRLNRIDDRFLTVGGATRTNIKIVERDGARITDLNFPGFSVSPEEEGRLEEAIGTLAARYRWVLFCGSVPAGAAPGIYARLIARARASGARVALDTSGPALVAALAAVPDVIKPNGEELGEALGRSITTLAEAAEAAREMRRRGVAEVMVSLGAEGAVFASGGEMVHAVGHAGRIRSTVGAGDALLSGYMLGLLRGLPLAGRARLATGFSLGALSMLGPHLPPVAQVESLAASVAVVPL